ncbi:MAG: hypothetical protein HQM08_18270 [Candidatus Riflebacteria bacterium]|nr:hypothetical protein [Candidatus Riflebacteria bacterium]
MEQSQVKIPKGFKELSVFFFLLKMVNNLFLIVLTSFFLKNLGAKHLPEFYVISNSLFVVTQFFFLRKPEFSGNTFLSGSAFPLFMLCFFFAVFDSFPLFLTTLAFLLVTIYDIHSTQAFSDMAGMIMPIRVLKKNLFRIHAFGTAGSVLSGIFLKYFMDSIGIRCLFSIICLLIIVSMVFIRKIDALIGEKYFPDSKLQIENKVDKNLDSHSNKLKEKSNPSFIILKYSFVLIAFSSIGIFGKIIIEFLFRHSVTLNFNSIEKMASFMGVFSSFSDSMVFLIQLFFAEQLTSKYSLSFLISFRSIAILMVLVVAYFFPGFSAIAALMFCYTALTKIFVNPTFVVFFEMLPSQLKVQRRRHVAIGDSISNILAGCFLYFFRDANLKDFYILILVLMFISVVAILLAAAINFLYSEVAKETLKNCSDSDTFEIIPVLKHIPVPNRIERISSLLKSENSEVRFRTIHETIYFDREIFKKLLLEWLVFETNIRNISAGVKLIFHKTGSEAMSFIITFLEKSSDPRIVSDLIEAVGNIRDKSAGTLLPPYLYHSNIRVKGNTILALMKTVKTPEIIQEAFSVLKKCVLSDSCEDRIMAIYVMRSSGLPFFVPTLEYLSGLACNKTSLKAIQALGVAGTPNAMRILQQKKHLTGIRGETARKVLNWTNEKKTSPLYKAMLSLGKDEKERISLLLRTLPREKTITVLGKIFLIENQKIRLGIIESLFGENVINKLDFLSEIFISENINLTIDEGLILKYLKNKPVEQLPVCADLLPFLLENRTKEYQIFLEEKLSEEVSEASILCRAIDLRQENSNYFSIAENRLNSRLQAIFHLVAFATKEPQNILDILKRSFLNDNFLHSIAHEYFEEHMGKKISRLLLLLLNWKNSAEFLHEYNMENSGFNAINLQEKEILCELKKMAER